MTVETSRKILKVFGILSIIFGILGAILAATMLFGGKAAVTSGELDVNVTPEQLRLLSIAAIFSLVSSVVSFLQGVFSVRAAKDFSKIMPAWIFAILDLLFSVADSVWNIINSAQARTIASAAISVALSILVLGAANKIKKHVGK
jgi:hypothetical protein